MICDVRLPSQTCIKVKTTFTWTMSSSRRCSRGPWTKSSSPMTLPVNGVSTFGVMLNLMAAASCLLKCPTRSSFLFLSSIWLHISKSVSENDPSTRLMELVEWTARHQSERGLHPTWLQARQKRWHQDRVGTRSMIISMITTGIKLLLSVSIILLQQGI